MELQITPNKFDVIILGTGVPESILAASLSVHGESVLHIDSHEFYGSLWSTLRVSEAVSFLTNNYGNRTAQENLEVETKDAEVLKFNLEENCSLFMCSKTFQTTETPIVLEKLFADVSGPRLSFCNGSMVDLLLRSGCHNYVEFRGLDSSYLWFDGKLKSVPSSRADIFQADMTLSEKRIVTRFFKNIKEHMEWKAMNGQKIMEKIPGFEGADPCSSFLEFLNDNQLPKHVQEWVYWLLLNTIILNRKY